MSQKPITAAHVEPDGASTDSEERIRAMVTEHFDAVWSFLRHLNVHELDDAAQEVMLIATRKVTKIRPGSERAFLFGAAYRIAAEARRRRTRRGEVDEEAIAELPDPGLGPDRQLDEQRGQRLLREVLDGMPLELHAVFVLSEIDELPMSEIAVLLSVPQGTVASRLRRARAEFEARLKRLRSSFGFPGGSA